MKDFQCGRPEEIRRALPKACQIISFRRGIEVEQKQKPTTIEKDSRVVEHVILVVETEFVKHVPITRSAVHSPARRRPGVCKRRLG